MARRRREPVAVQAAALRFPHLHNVAAEDCTERAAIALVRGNLAGIPSHGQRQWLEIRMLPVDEPVAGMTVSETEHAAALLARIAGKRRS